MQTKTILFMILLICIHISSSSNSNHYSDPLYYTKNPQDDVTFLSSIYSSPLPRTFSAKEKLSYIASLCDAEPYRGCYLNASINMPFDRPDYFDERYFNFTVYSEEDGCNRPLCSNDASSNNPLEQLSCMAKIPKDFKGNLITSFQAGDSPNLVMTYSITFLCDKKEQDFSQIKDEIKDEIKPNDVARFKDNCPPKSINLDQIIHLMEVEEVITSTKYRDAKKFSFIACGVRNSIQDVVISVVAQDISSAFATYVCLETPCNAHNAHWEDPSGKAINIVRKTLQRNASERLYVTVYGWSQYKEYSHFGLAMIITGPS